MAEDSGQSCNRFCESIGFLDNTVLITGGTGLIGKVLIEKILRTAPVVKRIYVIIRSKKGKNVQQRLQETFASPLFDFLKQVRGEEILEKVVAIEGDVSDIGLGLSKDDRQLLSEETQWIYHLAATVRFDEPLKRAVLLNTRGTREMLQLAKECKKLRVFAHCSTAYCHLEEKVLQERSYPPPADPHKIIKIVESVDEDTINCMTSKILGGAPNAYTMTKALAEALVDDEMNNLPIILLRPSVVIPIWLEPLPGWTDSLNGPVGLLIAAGKGLARSCYSYSSTYADFVPVDILANSILLASGDYIIYGERRYYNITSSFEFKITWEEVLDIGREIVLKKLPLNYCVWYPGGSMKNYKFIHQICVLLLHYFPAAILDCMIYISGNKPVVLKIQQRISKGSEVLEYYGTKQWEFNNDASLEARRLMNETEAKLYKVDGLGMDLHKYFYNAVHMARIHILKEPDDTIPAAKRHMKIMWAVDKICKTAFLVWAGRFLIQYLNIPGLS